MLFKSQLVTQASGSLGGITASRNRGGMYFRARTIPVDPNTPAQVAIRTLMAILVVRWNDILTPSERREWQTYADNVPLTGPLGDPITVSGINMFIRTNVHRGQNGRSLLAVGPPIFNLGTLSGTTIVNATAAAQTLDLTFDALDSWNVAAGYLALYVSRPVNVSIEYFRGPYRLAGLADGGLPSVSPVTLPSPFPFVAGQRLFARAIAMQSDGRLSEPQFIGPLLTVA